MKTLFFLSIPLVFNSCQSISIVDEIGLSRTEMSFNQKGADLMDCGLVSLVERGRSANGQSAGGGCASCH
ncbi:MAG: hypothetical protein ACSHYB_08140 [Roseibacillus sp.]